MIIPVSAIGLAFTLTTAVMLAALFGRGRPSRSLGRNPNDVLDLTHEDLVREVRDRAEQNGIDIPVQVFGYQPSVVIFEPSRRVHYVYRDQAALTIAIDDQQVTAQNASTGDRPRPVDAWSSAQLRKWLHQHRVEPVDVRPSAIRRRLRMQDIG
ncbi:MAG: hypothetical protein HKN26_07085 [Acidimicrobiales bacterium]|nr:hypothetical protein [Acidimicrobiales bacterium]